MAFIKPSRIIYELNGPDEINSESQKKFPKKMNVVDRKLGVTTYKKWGVVLNYWFSFDLQRGRLLCYKSEHSRHYSNYYSLIHGQFVEDEEEIASKEKIFQKKKNYIAPPSIENPNQSVIYVRTKKGKTFRLVTHEGESLDKIAGYLQVCFTSECITNAKAFVAMLGVGGIQVCGKGYKLYTGILVPLDNWQIPDRSPHNYLKSPENREQKSQEFSSLLSNIPVIGGIISALSTGSLSLIYNPLSQTVDVITFNSEDQPDQFFYQIFLILKKTRTSRLNSLKSQKSRQSEQNIQSLIMVPNVIVQQKLEDKEYILISESKSVSMYCKKCYIPILKCENVNEAMLTSRYDDELGEQNQKQIINIDDDDGIVSLQETDIVNSTFDFYQKALSYYPSSNDDSNITKEFVVSKLVPSLESQVQDISSIDFTIEDELGLNNTIQQINSIEVRMNRRQKNPPEIILDQQKDEVIEFKIEQLDPQGQRLSDDSDEDENENEQQQEQALAIAETKASYPHCNIKGLVAILKYAQEMSIKSKDDYRVEQAHKGGGSCCVDKKIVDLYRSVGKDMIKQIGRKIISGSFNLTTISFPIKAMIPRSSLEKSFMQTINFPLYMNRATTTKDPVERMKLLMVATLSNFIQANTFLKPLNPIIGETYQGSYDDGAQLYGEQISHHPSVTYFLLIGPKASYRFYGYYLYHASAGLNTVTFTNKGKRFVQFADGQLISFDFNQELYSGTFMGTMKHESFGQIIFKDETNGQTGTITLGKVKKRVSDYIDGDIKKDGKTLCRMSGSYMGFLDWDGVRYWDARNVLPFIPRVEQSEMQSDHSKRQDLLEMLKGNMDEAQIQKEKLEVMQRSDTKLRKEYEKNREKDEKAQQQLIKKKK